MFLVQEFFLILGNNLQCSVYRKTVWFCRTDKMPQFVNFSLSLFQKNIKVFSFACFFVFFPHCAACGIVGPHQGFNPCLLHWEHGILTPGLPRKYLVLFLTSIVALSGFSWRFCDDFLLCDLEFLSSCVLCSEFLSGVQPEEHPLAFIVMETVGNSALGSCQLENVFILPLYLKGIFFRWRILS